MTSPTVLYAAGLSYPDGSYGVVMQDTPPGTPGIDGAPGATGPAGPAFTHMGVWNAATNYGANVTVTFTGQSSNTAVIYQSESAPATGLQPDGVNFTPQFAMLDDFAALSEGALLTGTVPDGSSFGWIDSIDPVATTSMEVISYNPDPGNVPPFNVAGTTGGEKGNTLNIPSATMQCDIVVRMSNPDTPFWLTFDLDGADPVRCSTDKHTTDDESIGVTWGDFLMPQNGDTLRVSRTDSTMTWAVQRNGNSDFDAATATFTPAHAFLPHMAIGVSSPDIVLQLVHCASTLVVPTNTWSLSPMYMAGYPSHIAATVVPDTDDPLAYPDATADGLSGTLQYSFNTMPSGLSGPFGVENAYATPLSVVVMTTVNQSNLATASPVIPIISERGAGYFRFYMMNMGGPSTPDGGGTIGFSFFLVPV